MISKINCTVKPAKARPESPNYQIWAFDLHNTDGTKETGLVFKNDQGAYLTLFPDGSFSNYGEHKELLLHGARRVIIKSVETEELP